ncbi:MAG: SEL1-like repeat protein [Chthoniobacterales bacterium]
MNKTFQLIFTCCLLIATSRIAASPGININEALSDYAKSVDFYIQTLGHLAQEASQVDSTGKAISWINALRIANEGQKNADRAYYNVITAYEAEHPEVMTQSTDGYVEKHPEYGVFLKGLEKLHEKDLVSYYRSLLREKKHLEVEFSTDLKAEDAFVACYQSEPDEVKQAFGHINSLDEKKISELSTLLNNQWKIFSSYFQLLDQLQKDVVTINNANAATKLIDSLTEANEKKYEALEIDVKISQFFKENSPDFSGHSELFRSYIRCERMDYKFSKIKEDYSVLEKKTGDSNARFANNRNYNNAVIKMLERESFHAKKAPFVTQRTPLEIDILIKQLKMQKGDLLAQEQLAIAYATGAGVTKDTSRALLLLKDAAQKGLPEAEDELANCYLRGFLVPINFSEAERLYQQASFSNKPFALLLLGYFLKKLDPKTSFNLFYQAAKQKNASGEFYLAECYRYGTGVEKNEKEAIYWLKQAASQKNPQAEEILAFYYLSGNGVPKDIKQAVSYFYDGAMAGLIDAQFNYGIALWNGEGVEQSKSEGLKWVTSAAEKGYPQAEEMLGHLNFYGTDVPLNYQQALSWNEKAANHGSNKAKFLLGLAYSQGLGVAKNQETALAWFKQASDQGEKCSQYQLACYYLTDKGANPNIAEGMSLLKKSSDAGYPYAQFYYATFLFNGKVVPQDRVEACNLCRKAAEQGVPDAQLTLGQFLLLGKNCTLNIPEAIEWIRKAADQGLSEAEFRYGICYLEGIGVDKDPVEAVKWLRFGALQGNPSAQNALGYSYFIGIGVPNDLVEAYKWYLLAEPQEARDYIKETIAANIRNILPKLTPAQIKEAKEKAAQFVPLKKDHSAEHGIDDFYGSMGIS